MLIILVSVAFLASMLTFFSGFGLGTLLMPIFAIFMPLPDAIATTGVVHLLNNLFKLWLVKGAWDKDVLLKFGFTALIGTALGAWLLSRIGGIEQPLGNFEIANHNIQPTLVGMIVGSLIMTFAYIEWRGSFGGWKIGRKDLQLGGFLSGFFGGLSGHQGALRSAFLIKCGLTKEAFVATGIAISCAVDVVRVFIYGTASFERLSQDIEMHKILALSVLAAFAGAFIGNRLLKRATIENLQKFLAILLVVFGVLIALGIIS